MKKAGAILVLIIFITSLLFLYLTKRIPENNLTTHDSKNNAITKSPMQKLEIGEKPPALKIQEGF